VVPELHLARRVMTIVARFDIGSVEMKYSSLGRHGYHPRNVLSVWIYGSLIGLHESTKVAAALKTDAAFRLLSGGYAISEGTLRRFRRENRELFEQLIAQTVRIAHEEGLLKVDELAVDSWRLRADASLSAVGTLERSKARLAQLVAVDESSLDEGERERRARSLAKHRAIVEECERLGRTNVVRTNPSAGLLKFPYGASAPGHRVTVTAAGAKERIVVTAFVDAASTDHGHLGRAIDGALATLASVQALDGDKPRGAADAGYWSEDDLVYAATHADRIELHVPDPNADRVERYFGRERFPIIDGKATCPAGREMNGPFSDGGGRLRYLGTGCVDCALRPQCTAGQQRALTVRPFYEAAKLQMQTRTAQPDAKAFYKKRMAIIESVFANVEDAMGYRRATARVERSVLAEVLLKLLAHNISRLLARKPVDPLILVLDLASEF
jgi:transposase